MAAELFVESEVDGAEAAATQDGRGDVTAQPRRENVRIHPIKRRGESVHDRCDGRRAGNLERVIAVDAVRRSAAGPAYLKRPVDFRGAVREPGAILFNNGFFSALEAQFHVDRNQRVEECVARRWLDLFEKSLELWRGLRSPFDFVFVADLDDGVERTFLEGIPGVGHRDGSIE